MLVCLFVHLSVAAFTLKLPNTFISVLFSILSLVVDLNLFSTFWTNWINLDQFRAFRMLAICILCNYYFTVTNI